MMLRPGFYQEFTGKYLVYVIGFTRLRADFDGFYALPIRGLGGHNVEVCHSVCEVHVDIRACDVPDRVAS